jgi:PAS domain S-box-containing protein
MSVFVQTFWIFLSVLLASITACYLHERKNKTIKLKNKIRDLVALNRELKEHIIKVQNSIESTVISRTQEINFEKINALKLMKESIGTKKYLEEKEGHLKENLDKVFSALEASEIGIWTWDINKDQINWDSYAHKIFGLKPNTFQGRYCDFLMLVAKEDRNRIIQEVRDLVEANEDNLDTYCKIIKCDGIEIAISLKAKLYISDGTGAKFITGTLSDAKRDSDFTDSLKQFFSLSVDLFCVANTDGYFVELSNLWSDILGYSTEELMQNPFMHFVHPKDRKTTENEFLLLKTRKHRTINFTNRYRCSDGTYKTLLWNAVGVPREKKVLAIARDVTALDLESKLLSSEFTY